MKLFNWFKNRQEPRHSEIEIEDAAISKIPFTKDDIKTQEGEFDKLQDVLKDDQLHANMARADFYCSPHSPEDVEYAQSFDEMKCAEFGVNYTQNEINETQGQINHMTQTLENNHNQLNADWNKSNDADQGLEPER